MVRLVGAQTSRSSPTVVLVHGSFANAELLWGRQRALADRFTLVMPNRTGYPPHPPLQQIDFYDQAEDIAAVIDDGAHLVGYSYGGIVALLAAARRLDAVCSLTVIEPPLIWLGRGHPAVDQLALDIFNVFWFGPDEPRDFIELFLPLFGSQMPLPSQLPPALDQGARAVMAERAPWDARIPFDEVAAAPFPKLVVSGAHSAALDAICDVLQQRLGAERVVITGGGHNIPQLGDPFNEALTAFVERAERRNDRT